MTTMTQVPRFISADEVAAVFDEDLAYQSQVDAFKALGRGDAVLPNRVIVPGTGDDAFAFSYVARVRPGTGVVAKLGSVQTRNAQRGMPVVNALITCLDPDTGLPVAIMDGTVVTTRRTAAATAVAVDALRPKRRGLDVAVIGAGVQGDAHVRALARRPTVGRLRVASRGHGAADLAARYPDIDVSAFPSIDEAVAGADVIVLCTTASAPVITGEQVKDGALVVSIGSYSPELSEVADDVIARAALTVVDHRPTALAQAGPIVNAVATDVLKAAEIAELGEVLVGAVQLPEGSVFFNSVGLGVQDAAAAWSIAQALENKES